MFRLLRNRTKATNQFGTYPLIELVNGQQTLERVVLAAKPVAVNSEFISFRELCDIRSCIAASSPTSVPSTEREGQTVYSPSCCDTAIPVRTKLAITILAKAKYEPEGEKHTIELVNSAVVYKPHTRQTVTKTRNDTIYKANRPNHTFSDKDTEKTGTAPTVFQFHLLVVTAKFAVFHEDR